MLCVLISREEEVAVYQESRNHNETVSVECIRLLIAFTLWSKGILYSCEASI